MRATIKVEQLTKRFDHFTAVNQVSFSVYEGEIFGFLGANGAGKTTVIRMLCALLDPTSGSAQVAGYDLYTQAQEIRKQIGYMSQKFSLYEDLTVVENIELYATIYGLSRATIRERTSSLLHQLQFTTEANHLVKSLPVGWRQKLSFLLAIIHRPQVVFLDEPTSGVDPITRREFWNLIYETAESGITVFVTTHYMDESEYCNRISMMVDGNIEALGTPDHLKNLYQAATMDDVFYKLARQKESL